jgi:hypothetical protein
LFRGPGFDPCSLCVLLCQLSSEFTSHAVTIVLSLHPSTCVCLSIRSVESHVSFEPTLCNGAAVFVPVTPCLRSELVMAVCYTTYGSGDVSVDIFVVRTTANSRILCFLRFTSFLSLVIFLTPGGCCKFKSLHLYEPLNYKCVFWLSIFLSRFCG